VIACTSSSTNDGRQSGEENVLNPLVTLAAVAGLTLALLAVVMEGTGVTGTLGAWLAVLGSAAALVGVVLLAGVRLGRGMQRLVVVTAVLASGLTAVAAWFLMQNILAALMAFVCLAIPFVASRRFYSRKVHTV
jgi:hypothetical protein